MQHKCKLLKDRLWKVLKDLRSKNGYSLLHYKWNAGKNPRALRQKPQKAHAFRRDSAWKSGKVLV